MENSAYSQLIDLTNSIVAEARKQKDANLSARPAAFAEARRRRPDLAAKAVYPGGKPVQPAEAPGPSAEVSRTEGDFNARVAAAGQSALAKACEALGS